MTYTLRALDPVRDLEHFQTAYNWRTARRGERGGLTIPLTEFLEPRPNEVSVGLFNGELQAVYLIQQRSSHGFQAHFATKRQGQYDIVARGAITLKNWLFAHGALEVYGLLLPEHTKPNHPLRRFAERVGFSYCGEMVQAGIVGDRQVVMLKYTARR